MAVCIATTAPWIGGSLPSRSVPSSATRAMPSGCSPFSDEADVKYISSAPGTRRLTLPCPLAEMAPPASTFAAVSSTWSTRFLSIDVSPLTSPVHHERPHSSRPGAQYHGPPAGTMLRGGLRAPGHGYIGIGLMSWK